MSRGSLVGHTANCAAVGDTDRAPSSAALKKNQQRMEKALWVTLTVDSLCRVSGPVHGVFVMPYRDITRRTPGISPGISPGMSLSGTGFLLNRSLLFQSNQECRDGT